MFYNSSAYLTQMLLTIKENCININSTGKKEKRYALVKIDDDLFQWIIDHEAFVYYTGDIEYNAIGSKMIGYYEMKKPEPPKASESSKRVKIKESYWCQGRYLDNSSYSRLIRSQCFLPKFLYRLYRTLRRKCTAIDRRDDELLQKELDKYNKKFALNIETISLP